MTKSVVPTPPITFSQTPGPMGDLFRSFGVSHAAKIPMSGFLVVTSGQPGFDLETGQLVTESIEKQFEACLDCVEAALKSAGAGDGLASAHKLTAYLLDTQYDPLLMEIWRRRMPKHQPTFVVIGIAQLALPGMHIEMHAEAMVFG